MRYEMTFFKPPYELEWITYDGTPETLPEMDKPVMVYSVDDVLIYEETSLTDKKAWLWGSEVKIGDKWTYIERAEPLPEKFFTPEELKWTLVDGTVESLPQSPCARPILLYTRQVCISQYIVVKYDRLEHCWFSKGFEGGKRQPRVGDFWTYLG
jgi:hypothetical protein